MGSQAPMWLSLSGHQCCGLRVSNGSLSPTPTPRESLQGSPQITPQKAVIWLTPFPLCTLNVCSMEEWAQTSQDSYPLPPPPSLKEAGKRRRLQGYLGTRGQCLPFTKKEKTEQVYPQLPTNIPKFPNTCHSSLFNIGSHFNLWRRGEAKEFSFILLH